MPELHAFECVEALDYTGPLYLSRYRGAMVSLVTTRIWLPRICRDTISLEFSKASPM